MTVKELIEELQKYPDELIVLTAGRDSGYDLLEKPNDCYVSHCPNEDWRIGEYQIHSPFWADLRAVVLSRKQKDVELYT